MSTLLNIENEQLIPVDKNIPLGEILDTENLLKLINSLYCSSDTKNYSDIKIIHIRFSPKKSCIISFKAKKKNDNSYSHFYTRSMNKEIYQKVITEIEELSLLESIKVISDSQMIVCRFPIDAKLNLSPILKMSATEPYEILRYKPETRFVARFKSFKYDSKTYRNVIARIELPEKVHNSYENTSKILSVIQENDIFSVPPILLYAQKDSLLVQEQVDAVPFAKKLLNLDSYIINKVAKALAKLHTLSIQGVVSKNAESFVNQFERSSKILTFGNVDIERKLNEIRIALMLRLSDLNSSKHVLIHGDFHQGQVLLSDSQTWIIDLDSIAIGSPAVDLGNFSAQLKKLEFKSLIKSSDDLFNPFLNAYQEKTKIVLDEKEIQFYVACSLVELSVKELRRMRKNWYTKIMQLFDESLRILKS